MGKPIKKPKGLPKGTKAEELTNQEVLEAVFSEQAQQLLRDETTPEEEPKMKRRNSYKTI
jgi:hypothetical protein